MNTNNLVVTNYKEKNICFCFRDGQIEELIVDNFSNIHVNDIYVGRISSVKQDLKAYFVEFQKGVTGFLSFDEVYEPSIITKRDDNLLKQGDLVCVQVIKDRIKSKEYTLSLKLSIPGKYSVVTFEDRKIHYSSKLKSEDIGRINSVLSLYEFKYGFVIRTNASYAKENEILEDINNGIDYLSLVEKELDSRTLYSKLFFGHSTIYERINGISSELYDEIITDQKDLFDELSTLKKVRFYEDKSISLKTLYSFDKAFSLATDKKVNLKSGGYLIIEPTEALTVIDVNSGKFDKKTDKNNAIRIINNDAAIEVCRQLRLRNISGIVIIDFININEKAHRDELISLIKKELKKDSCKASFIDVTDLGLIELTREKKYQSVYDSLKNIY